MRSGYFTVQSNLLVLLTTVQLACRPDRDGETWRVLRAAAVAGITVTGLVHFVLLRPLLDLDGWSNVADKMLHLVVPALAVAGWLMFGPRPRKTGQVVLAALGWPLAWLALTLTVGAVSGRYPYPFLDPAEKGADGVALAAAGITVLFVLVLAAQWWVDRRKLRQSVAPA